MCFRFSTHLTGNGLERESGKVMDYEKKVNQILFEIDDLVESGLTEAAFEQYIELINGIQDNKYDIVASLKVKVYESFAFLLFNLSEYDVFFNMLIRAQDYGVLSNEAEKLISEAFIEPNVQELRSIYEANMSFLLSNNYIDTQTAVDFCDLPFWLLPNGNEYEYYLYHKHDKKIQEKITLFNFEEVQEIPVENVFSDYVLLENWSWYNTLSCLNVIRKANKKTYIVINDIAKFLSCLQGSLLSQEILSDVYIFDKIERMRRYFLGSDCYLPRNTIDLTDNEKTRESINELIYEVHQKRIKEDNRRRNRVKLSICIPSYNRGKRAYNNVLHLLNSVYDEEIEIIISNNGTQNDTKEFYDKLQDIHDTRLNYFSFQENQGFAINCCKVIELARGEFILLISDEDLVNFNHLDKVLNMLDQSMETIALVRTSSTHHNTQTSKTAQAGEEALLSYMLTSNYMSGMILNNRLLKEHKAVEYVKNNLDNSTCFWYPHMFWELLLCQYGTVKGTDLILVNEGQVEATDCEKVEIAESKVEVPYYATIEGRLEQHKGFLNIFRDLEACQKSTDLLRKMYIKLSAKTLFLVALSIRVYYKNTNENLLGLLNRAYAYCVDTNMYKENITEDHNKYLMDAGIIERHYSFNKGTLKV